MACANCGERWDTMVFCCSDYETRYFCGFACWNVWEYYLLETRIIQRFLTAGVKTKRLLRELKYESPGLRI